MSADIAFLDAEIAWQRSRAGRARLAYNAGRVTLIVLSAALPALTAHGHAGWATLVAVAVAALAGLDAQFRPGELWRHHRASQLALERIRREHERAIARGEDPAATDAATIAAAERAVADEAAGFWSFRITPWRTGRDGES